VRIPLGEETMTRTAEEIMEESWNNGSVYWEDKDGSMERELREDATALDADVVALRARLAELEAKAMNATPSKLLSDWCTARGITRRSMAASIGCSPAAVQFIINGTMRVTADMAIKLEHVTHIPAVDWLISQAHADLSKVRKA